jgi:phenylacetate-CoA ligase
MSKKKIEITPLESWISKKIGNQEETLIRQKLQDYQLERFNETLALVKLKSPFYRERLADIEKLNSLEDIKQIPFTYPEDLKESALKLLCVSQSEISRIVTLDSSGTTGKSKRIYFTTNDQELTIDFFHHGMATLVGKKDRVIILLPFEREGSVGDLLLKGLSRLGVEAIPYGLVKNIPDTLKKIEEEKITSLVGIPVQVLALARYGENKNYDLRINNVLLSTDHVPQAIKKTISDLWQCDIYEHYGMTEMGLGGGINCDAQGGYHLREADLYFEIINPATGFPLPTGEYGEVVFTTLTRKGMPLIRYRTGDLTRLMPGKCPCHTMLRRMEPIRARVEGQVKIGKKYYLTMADLDEVLFTLPYVVDFEVFIHHLAREVEIEFKMFVLPIAEKVQADEFLSKLRKIDSLALAEATGEVKIRIEKNILQETLTHYGGKRRIWNKGIG